MNVLALLFALLVIWVGFWAVVGLLALMFRGGRDPGVAALEQRRKMGYDNNSEA